MASPPDWMSGPRHDGGINAVPRLTPVDPEAVGATDPMVEAIRAFPPQGVPAPDDIDETLDRR